jgi:hypothetical protein
MPEGAINGEFERADIFCIGIEGKENESGG